MLYYFAMPAKGFTLPSATSGSRNLLLLIVFASTLLKLYIALNTGIYVDQKTDLFRPLNDEYSHYKFISFLIREHRLPVNEHVRSIQDPEAWIFQDFEYAQPPLYYAASVPFALLPNPVFWCRLFSILLGTLTLVLVIDSAYVLLKPGESGAILAAILLGFHPVFLRIGSSISNDNLAWFLSALQFRLLISDRNLARVLPFVVLSAAGIMTKMSYLIWPLFFFLWMVWDLFHKERRRALNAGMILVLSLAATSWLFLRNHRLYGDYSGLIGGSGPKGAFLLSGRFEALADFARESVRYLFFPVAEDPAGMLPLCGAIVLFFVLFLTFRYRQVKSLFADPQQFNLCALFTLLSFLLYLQANLYWQFTESRHLFIGILPLFVLGCAILLDAFPSAAPGVAGAMQVIPLLYLW